MSRVRVAQLTNKVPQVLEMYRLMLTIREFDLAAAQSWREKKMRASMHQYVGQEAIAVGVSAHLRRTDYVNSNHRGHGHSIAKGADPVSMMKELFGRVGGTCGGKAGSMHIADFSVGMLGANGIVADGATLAVGAAHSIRILRQDRISVAYFGDGAVNRGPLMEAFNWSKVYNLPVLFVCEDNAYAATTRSKTMTSGDGFVARARSFGLDGHAVDGNDVLAVSDAAADVIGRVRAGGGPAFIYATTYRHSGHSMSREHESFRDPSEKEDWLRRDPIARCGDWLKANDVCETELEHIRAEVLALIHRALEEADKAPWPDRRAAFADVQDLGSPIPAEPEDLLQA